MAVTAAQGERYTIRRKVFQILGAGFHVYDPHGRVVGFCKQRAFRLKEDFRVYTDDSLTQELFKIGARQIIDFGATYDVKDPSDGPMGSLRRKGLKSMIRDEWLVYDQQGSHVATLIEDSGAMAILRRMHELAAACLPQKLSLRLLDGTPIATYRTHFNPFIYRLGVTVHQDHDTLDDLMILAMGCVFAAIDGRQR